MGSDKKLLTTDVFEAMAPSLDQARADVLVVHGDVWIEEPGYRLFTGAPKSNLSGLNMIHAILCTPIGITA